ncbi:hypothetical protein EVAR_74322_1 [Eumeta japonica]|uniref:Secreted protein n=1 Tax=Eumeta variegata TaxID=151549 RepID=A0A4C1SD19_EUMVA|nr:hypothetical protein EVAR_74322_1 [Eumeta japonica]
MTRHFLIIVLVADVNTTAKGVVVDVTSFTFSSVSLLRRRIPPARAITRGGSSRSEQFLRDHCHQVWSNVLHFLEVQPIDDAESFNIAYPEAVHQDRRHHSHFAVCVGSQSASKLFFEVSC